MKNTLLLAAATALFSGLLTGCNLYEFDGRMSVNSGLTLQELSIPEGVYQNVEVELDVDRKTQVATIEIKFEKGTLNNGQRKFEIEVGAIDLVRNQGMQLLTDAETGIGYDIKYNLRNEVYRGETQFAQSCYEVYGDCYEEQIVYDYAYLNFVLLLPGTDVEVATYAGSDILETVEKLY